AAVKQGVEWDERAHKKRRRKRSRGEPGLRLDQFAVDLWDRQWRTLYASFGSDAHTVLCLRQPRRPTPPEIVGRKGQMLTGRRQMSPAHFGSRDFRPAIAGAWTGYPPVAEGRRRQPGSG